MNTVSVEEVVRYLEQKAPLPYQEPYDNSGLLVGNPLQPITGILVSLDCTEAVITEAQAKQCNLIVSHHPIIFGGLKRLIGKTYVERAVMRALEAKIALYAAHTNLDNVRRGVCQKMAEQLALTQTRLLEPRLDTLLHLICFVPTTHTTQVTEALYEAGAGALGNYEKCSFSVNGQGSFLPKAGAQPYIGHLGKPETVEETRLEVVLPRRLQDSVMDALRKAHPYEEIAHYLVPTLNADPMVGAGMVGELPQPMETTDFLSYLKERMNTSLIRHTAPLKKPIQRVALCGGAGKFLLNSALRENADAYISSDFKYHDFFEADGKILIADIGHYESEQFTKNLFKELLDEKFTTFATSLSEAATNPVRYF